MKYRQNLIAGIVLVTAPFFASSISLADENAGSMVYDETAYTAYVEATMNKLDRLYLDFCASCNVDASKAGAAKREFLATVRDLMQHMNGRFDALDPKAGAALSHTETLVSIHVLTMLVDILTEIQIEEMTAHPYIG